jgi:hypothetical protein
VLGEKRDHDAALGAKAHEGRAARDLTETDQASNRENGNLELRFALDANDYGFPLLRDVGPRSRVSSIGVGASVAGRNSALNSRQPR